MFFVLSLTPTTFFLNMLDRARTLHKRNWLGPKMISRFTSEHINPLLIWNTIFGEFNRKIELNYDNLVSNVSCIEFYVAISFRSLLNSKKKILFTHSMRNELKDEKCHRNAVQKRLCRQRLWVSRFGSSSEECQYLKYLSFTRAL